MINADGVATGLGCLIIIIAILGGSLFGGLVLMLIWNHLVFAFIPAITFTITYWQGVLAGLVLSIIKQLLF